MKLSKGELAEKLKMTRQNLFYIIKGKKTSLENIEKIAKVLDVEPKELLL